MNSVRANFFKYILRTTNNINPILHHDAAMNMRKMAAPYINEKVPKGFVMEKVQTENGTKYQRMRRKKAAKPDKALYFLHGGAYITGLIDMYRTFTAEFCDAIENLEVILLDYDLAPDAKYPTQLNQAMDVWSEITDRLGYRPNQIVVGGDSSGGNLTLAMMLRLRDEEKGLPLGAFLLSPWTDMTCSGRSYYRNYRKDVEIGEKKQDLTPNKLKTIIESDLFCFIGNADRMNPYISPVFGSYQGFPPMMICVGEDEMLLDDSLQVVQKMREDGVSVICESKSGMFHTYVLYMDYMPESKESLKKLIAFVKGLYYSNPNKSPDKFGASVGT